VYRPGVAEGGNPTCLSLLVVSGLALVSHLSVANSATMKIVGNSIKTSKILQNRSLNYVIFETKLKILIRGGNEAENTRIMGCFF